MDIVYFFKVCIVHGLNVDINIDIGIGMDKVRVGVMMVRFDIVDFRVLILNSIRVILTI